MKGNVLHQYLWTVRWGNGYNTNLPLQVFTPWNLVADFIRLKWNFIQLVTWLAITKTEAQASGWCCMRSMFANSLNFLITWGLPVTISHWTCIFCVHSIALHWQTLLYVCVYVSFQVCSVPWWVLLQHSYIVINVKNCSLYKR